MGVPGFRPRGVASRFRGLLATAWRMARGAFFHFCICHIVSSFNSLRPWIRIADRARGAAGATTTRPRAGPRWLLLVL